MYVDDKGGRRSPYANGAWRPDALVKSGATTITRWVHRACDPGGEIEWMESRGWVRRPIPGKTWRSGRQAFEIVNTKHQEIP